MSSFKKIESSEPLGTSTIYFQGVGLACEITQWTSRMEKKEVTTCSCEFKIIK